MAFTSFDEFKEASLRPSVLIRNSVLDALYAVNADCGWQCTWANTSGGGETPVRDGTNASTATALDYTGANGDKSVEHPASLTRLMVASVMTTTSASTPVVYLLVDRLSHQGGLVGNVTSLQTTNLPTAALTRYTDGVGVWGCLHLQNNVGATNATCTVIYTNQAGTGSRTGTCNFADTIDPGTIFNIIMQDGDTGIRSVESIQFDISTGTAGDIAVILYKPLVILDGSLDGYQTADKIVGWNEPILSEAHLDMFNGSVSTSVTSQSFSIGYMDR